MPRDVDAIKITRKWASSGLTAAIVGVSADDGIINREKGFPPRYSDPTMMGKVTTTRQINQVLKEITGMCLEINRGGGVPEFSAARQYVHPATVLDAGQAYKSQPGAVDLHLNRPSNDADESHWVPVIKSTLEPAPANSYPANANGPAGTDGYVTPERFLDWALGAVGPPVTFRGTVISPGTRPGGIFARSDHSHSALAAASETVRGIIRLATAQESTAGASRNTALTPATLRGAFNARYALKTHNHDTLYAKENHTHG